MEVGLHEWDTNRYKWLFVRWRFPGASQVPIMCKPPWAFFSVAPLLVFRYNFPRPRVVVFNGRFLHSEAAFGLMIRRLISPTPAHLKYFCIIGHGSWNYVEPFHQKSSSPMHSTAGPWMQYTVLQSFFIFRELNLCCEQSYEKGSRICTS